MRRFPAVIVLIALLASGMLPGAACAWAEAGSFTMYDAAARIRVGQLVAAALPGNADLTLEYSFSPDANGDYEVCLFPADDVENAAVELCRGGAVIAGGEGFGPVLTGRLTAGVEYTLRLRGSGSVLLEVARHSLCRCFGMALDVEDGGGYAKKLVRSGDVHWYRVRAASDGAAIVFCRPETGALRPLVRLFDGEGHPLQSSETLVSGTAVLRAAFSSENEYLLRVEAADGGVGKYALGMLRSPVTVRPEAVSLSSGELTLSGRESAALTTQVAPANACELVLLDSALPQVAAVDAEGIVTGGRPGTASVVAYAYGGARSSCRVTVERAAVTGVCWPEETLSMTVGGEALLAPSVQPENATERSVRCESSDTTVAAIQDGRLLALREGTAQVTAVSADGGFSAVLTVNVTAVGRTRRALLIGEQEYASTVKDAREGSVLSVRSVAALLRTARFEDGGGYRVTTLMDASRDTVLATIRRVLGKAREGDLTLIYFTCHGFYRAGMTFFVMSDGSVLSALELAQALAEVPGEKLILADCCGSGGLIGRAGEAGDILEGIRAVFAGQTGDCGFTRSRCRVIASARLDQDSYRIDFGSAMSTVFARSLCDACGWSIDRGAASSMNADTDYDGTVTMAELDSYLFRRMKWYLALAGDYTQNVCVWPEGDPTVVFRREPRS